MKPEKLSQQDNIPALGDWVNLTEGAEILGYSRQYMYKLAQGGKFESLHRIGTQPTFVVSKADIQNWQSVRDAVDNDTV